MSRLLRLSAVFALSLAAGTAFASGSSAPFNPQPDPSLKTASKPDLEARVRRACVAIQAQQASTASAGSLTGPCGCYATRIINRLDKIEMAAYRETGVFNETARTKALAALDACKLPRPRGM